MATIKPFRAIRYNENAVTMRDVVTPPYDVIDDDYQSILYNESPHNFIRIDLNKINDTDTDDNNRYTRARGYLFDWMAKGIMKLDEEPGVYRHIQTFKDETGTTITRKGFFALIKLAEYDENIVLPHERTLRGPKIDRLDLMKATGTHLSPVFFLYDDPTSDIDHKLDRTQSTKIVDVTTDDGIHHQLWKITEYDAIAEMQEQLNDQQVLIADGHHRYETALAYRDYRRECAEENLEDAAYEYALGFFCNFRDPGLAVYGTHRVVHGLDTFDWSTVISTIETAEHFKMEALTTDASEKAIRDALESAGAEHPSFVLMANGQSPRVVSFVGTNDTPIFDEATPNEVRELDVAVLHEGIFDRVLGISKEAQEAKTNLKYIKGFSDAVQSVSDTNHQMVVLMNATKVEQVDSVCKSGGKMPQKSTFFYPKVLSGLLLNPA